MYTFTGNTLRGMRTHIRTHFDKRVSDLMEGEYMTWLELLFSFYKMSIYKDIKLNMNFFIQKTVSHHPLIHQIIIPPEIRV